MLIAMSCLGNITGALMVLVDPVQIALSNVSKLRDSTVSMGHGGDVETSHMLYIFPDLVHMEEAISKPRK